MWPCGIYQFLVFTCWDLLLGHGWRFGHTFCYEGGRSLPVEKRFWCCFGDKLFQCERHSLDFHSPKVHSLFICPLSFPVVLSWYLPWPALLLMFWGPLGWMACLFGGSSDPRPKRDMQSICTFTEGAAHLVSRSLCVVKCHDWEGQATPGWKSCSRNRLSEGEGCLILRNNASIGSIPQVLGGCLDPLGFACHIGSGTQSTGKLGSTYLGPLSPIIQLFYRPGRPGGGAYVLQIC